MAEKNPVLGFKRVKDKKYKKDCKLYGSLRKRILNTELKITSNPEKSGLLHEPLSGKCVGLLHARVDQNMRILYEPYYKRKIVLLKRFLPHREMEKKCN